MRYTQGTVGRIFVMKFDDGDIVVDEITKIARKERIKAAALICIGALRRGHLVTGPKKPVIPPDPNWVRFRDGWEVMGIGTIFANARGPQIHLHASMGKKRAVLTGCVRKESRVFLVIEAIVFELKGVKAAKDLDPKTGLNLLHIMG